LVTARRHFSQRSPGAPADDLGSDSALANAGLMAAKLWLSSCSWSRSLPVRLSAAVSHAVCCRLSLFIAAGVSQPQPQPKWQQQLGGLAYAIYVALCSSEQQRHAGWLPSDASGCAVRVIALSGLLPAEPLALALA
jgi:hypothetical protein